MGAKQSLPCVKAWKLSHRFRDGHITVLGSISNISNGTITLQYNNCWKDRNLVLVFVNVLVREHFF